MFSVGEDDLEVADLARGCVAAPARAAPQCAGGGSRSLHVLRLDQTTRKRRAEIIGSVEPPVSALGQEGINRAEHQENTKRIRRHMPSIPLVPGLLIALGWPWGAFGFPSGCLPVAQQ